jgi:predicted MFS family arabinose efflux permease
VIVATALAAAAVWRMPEPSRPSRAWRLQRPSVPPVIRTRLVPLSMTCAAVWAVGALFLSVIPSYAAKLLETSDLALLGAISAGMLAVACAVQAVAVRRGLTPARAQPIGLALLVGGIAALLLAFPARSLALVLTGATLAGAGLGLAYFGSQAEINRIAPPERRGEVTAAFITCLYVAVATTSISVGLMSDAASLAAAVRMAGIAVAAAATATAVWHLVGES